MQAASILQQSFTAMTGGVAINDATLTGTITISFGTATQSGTLTVVTTASGQGQLTLNLPLGTTTEVRSLTANGPTLAEAASDGVFHSVNTQSALAPHPAVFFPAFLLGSGLSSPQYSVSYVGQETRYGTTVKHLVMWLAQSNPYVAVGQQRSGQHDIYIDVNSGLVRGITFTAHPYDASNPDKQFVSNRVASYDNLEEVTFSDFRSVNNSIVPFQIQTSLYLQNGTLASSIQFSQVSLNTGAAITQN
ncbi:MAG TPA: hypothetical protein VEJ46_12155 [Candidatus Acidoferrum sp.]|nr:hypothetical protein [Candidatus Acidoferrum sp.]